MRAIILLNMGAPRDLDEVELFLKNMFNDPNILTIKSDLFRSILAKLITSSRKKEARSNYQKIGGYSPLVDDTNRLLKKLQDIYKEDLVLSIMRYTPPFAKEVIKELKDRDIIDIILLPLYPHYSTTTVKSSLDDFYTNAKELNLKANIKEIKPYYKQKSYNSAIIETIRSKTPNNHEKIDLIFSAHSLPQKIVDSGDSYQKEVIEHVDILTKELKNEGLLFNSYKLAYQSKLGPVKWLEPSLEDTLKDLKSKSALIVPISFSLENSETIFELHIEYKELAYKLGYDFYEVANTPSTSDLAIKAYTEMIDAI